MIKQSLALRVLVISFIVLALPLLIDSFIFFQNTYNDSISDAKRGLKEIADFRSYSLIEIQPVRQTFLKSVIYLLDLNNRLDKPDQQALSRDLKEIGLFAGGNLRFYLLDSGPGPNYRILATNTEANLNEPFVSYSFLETVLEKQEETFVRYLYSKKEGRYIPAIILARSILSNTTGKPVGIFMVVSEVEKELTSILSNTKEETDVHFALLNSDGVVFIASDHDLLGDYFNPISETRRQEIINSGQLKPHSLAHHPQPVIRGQGDPFFEFIFEDQVQIAYRKALPSLDLSIIAYSQKEAFFGKAVKHFLFVYTVYGLVLVIGGGVAYYLSSWIARPLRQLSNLMSEVGAGKLDGRFQAQPWGFEINQLGMIFNETLDKLLENIQKAEDERVKKEIYQRELAIGRQVQKNLLPMQMPAVEGIELAGAYLPAKEVGGDFYGWLKKQTQEGEEKLVIGVADASGHGISSCLYALNARSLARSYSMIYDDVGEVLSRTNNTFLEDAGDTGMFVTMFWSFYSPRTRILSYYSCGHVPGIVRNKEGQISNLAHTGMALGLMEADEPYKPDQIQLNPGDVVLLFTDGLLEVANEKNQIFSERRLKSCLQQRKWTTAQEVVDGLIEEVQNFSKSMSQEEEVIIVALRVL